MCCGFWTPPAMSLVFKALVIIAFIAQVITALALGIAATKYMHRT